MPHPLSYKIAVVIPWFGITPPMYHLWRTSILRNSTIDFYLFTDQDIVPAPNLHVRKTSFGDLVKMIQQCFDFDISCAHPYKLCDYRPAYGLIFKDLLAPYDFWGYCDMDMVFGDIRQFLSEEVLGEYDKIFVEGHLSLFRNNDTMNNLFMSQGVYPEYNYREAFSTNKACYFDEYRGMELKCLRHGIRIYNDGSVRRNYLPTDRFFHHRGVQEVCVWREGHLFARDIDGSETEILYVHIFKRRMSSDIPRGDKVFIITPGLIVAYEGTQLEEYFHRRSGGRGYKYLWYFGRMKKLLSDNTIGDIIKGRKRMRACARYKVSLKKINEEQ